jgi:hypothetical protein
MDQKIAGWPRVVQIAVKDVMQEMCDGLVVAGLHKRMQKEEPAPAAQDGSAAHSPGEDTPQGEEKKITDEIRGHSAAQDILQRLPGDYLCERPFKCRRIGSSEGDKNIESKIFSSTWHAVM